MARQSKLTPGIQVFRGSRPGQDVYSATLHGDCCGDGNRPDYDKLASRVRFDNSLAHSNPTGANDKFRLPYGNGFANTRADIVRGINDNGIGYNISVLAIPTYAFVTGFGLHIAAAETGLTFDVVTRNGLVLPTSCLLQVSAEGDGCDITRTLTVDGEGEATVDPYNGIGGLTQGEVFRDYFARDDGCGQFSLEPDEIALQVATMPSSGKVIGEFDITVSVSYDIIHRAEA